METVIIIRKTYTQTNPQRSENVTIQIDRDVDNMLLN